MADGGLRLVVDTQELVAEDKAEVMGLHNKLGWFVFSEAQIQEEDIPTDPIEVDDQKTLHERLDGVLYAYHLTKTNDAKSFHTFKREVYETIIQRYKDKLSELKGL